MGSVRLFYFLLWLLHTRFHVSVATLMGVEPTLIFTWAAAFRAIHCGHRYGDDFVEVRESVLYRPQVGLNDVVTVCVGAGLVRLKF